MYPQNITSLKPDIPINVISNRRYSNEKKKKNRNSSKRIDLQADDLIEAIAEDYS